MLAHVCSFCTLEKIVLHYQQPEERDVKCRTSVLALHRNWIVISVETMCDYQLSPVMYQNMGRIDRKEESKLKNGRDNKFRYLSIFAQQLQQYRMDDFNRQL